MEAVRRPVLDRRPPYNAAPSRLANFVLGDASPANAATALEPDWSLHCLELDDRGPDAAVFVRLPGGLLSSTGPFAYQDQLDRATEVLVVELSVALEMAAELPVAPDVAFLFSTGRCGSTLASRIFAELPGVVSLSEPDPYLNIVHLRPVLTDEVVVELVRAATVLLCHAVGADEATTVVIKPRSEPVLQAPLYAEALPDARHAFLYRDCRGYVASAARFGIRMLGENPRGTVAEMRPFWDQLTGSEPLSTLARVVDVERDDIGLHELLPVMWALKIRAFLAARERGLADVDAIHYEDLVADRDRQTARLLRACGLDPAAAPRVMAAFDGDSHGGGLGGNDHAVRPLTDRERAEIERQLPHLGLPIGPQMRV